VPEPIRDEQPRPAPNPLPRGRHKLSVETVRASQRTRILEAMLDEVADRGYDATTVAQVVSRARVSRNAFYVLFEDKLDCFIALCEMLTEQLLAETFDVEGAETWREAVHVGTLRYLQWWAKRPRFARAWLVEAPVAGRQAADQRQRAYERFEERFEQVAAWARAQERDLAPLHETAALAVVAAITALITEQVDAGRGTDLERLAPEIEWLIERVLAERA
jgi:AcrR family transcriptional regulator